MTRALSYKSQAARAVQAVEAIGKSRDDIAVLQFKDGLRVEFSTGVALKPDASLNDPLLEKIRHARKGSNNANAA